MNKYEIVELTLADLPKCSSFWGYPNARLEEFLKSGSRKVFAYRTGDEYVGGCALIVPAKKSLVVSFFSLLRGKIQLGHFSDFFVREDLRGRGIGSHILEFAIDYFKEKGIKKIRLHVDKDNPAIRLYTKYGFKHFEDMTPEKIAMIKDII